MTKPTIERWEEIEKELFEKLASIEHQRWAGWQKWCHKVLRENCPSPELERVLERWDKQIATDYENLTEKEKDSDREQVMRYWKLIKSKFSLLEEEIRGRKHLITVGYHKGEMDFGVSCLVGDLDHKQMKELREMIVVAIGTMEDMWRRNQEAKRPTGEQKLQSLKRRKK